jgi:dipeptidyl aminopeptidase/acylaminoacyl peptidase
LLYWPANTHGRSPMSAPYVPLLKYFPNNYRWSAGFVNMLSSAPYGGSEIAELTKIGSLLLEAAGRDDDEAWFDACEKIGDDVRMKAEKYEASGHRFSAAHAYLRATNYYLFGERFRTPKDERGLAVYRTAVNCFHKHVRLTDVKIEIVEVPFEGASLPGYFVHAQNKRAERSPCVVFFDGLDVTKETQYMRGVTDLIKRGINVLVMDGPATGEAIRFRKLYLRHDYEAAGSACIDYLEKRPEVDAKRIGIIAISLGGYYAPRCASMDPRFAACVAWGAIWDYYATWKKRIDAQFKTALSVPGHHIMWILGVNSLEEALKKLEPFRLDGVVQKMRCPFLIVHGDNDEQVPVSDARKLYEASGSPDKTLRVFTAEEGGTQHCQRDYLTLVVAEMWDWFEDKLFA